jgi:hypothetical protein
VQITRWFFYLLAALWLAVGIGYIGQSDGRIFFYVMAGLMFASIFVFIALITRVRRTYPIRFVRSIKVRRILTFQPSPSASR